jgi:hypothetical protein
LTVARWYTSPARSDIRCGDLADRTTTTFTYKRGTGLFISLYNGTPNGCPAWEHEACLGATESSAQRVRLLGPQKRIFEPQKRICDSKIHLRDPQKTFPRAEIRFDGPKNRFLEPEKGFAEPEKRPYERVKRVSTSEKRIEE